MVIQQLSLFLENRPGQLLHVTSLLAENGINLRAINLADSTDFGVLRLIVDDPRRAAALLSEAGFVLSVTPVVAVAVPDDPGALDRLLQRIAEAEINLEYMYSVLGRKADLAYMILRVSEPERLENLLPADGLNRSEKPNI